MNRLVKTCLAGTLVAFVLLFVTSTFLPPPAAELAQARRYFTDDQIATGRLFSFERNLYFWYATAVELGLLITFALIARPLTNVFSRWTGYDAAATAAAPGAARWQRLRTWGSHFSRWLATLLLLLATYAVAHELLQLPIAVGRYELSRAWGMTTQPFDDWFNQHLLSAAIGFVAEVITAVGLYVLLRWFPRTWFLWGTAGGVAFAFMTALLLPVLIAPLFNTFTPLSDTEWAALESPVRHLAEEAGIPVDRIYVADASRQGNHTNAYFTGLGTTQSIVLYDTLLKKHPRAEIESILAHEIGHWTHRHIVKGILLGGLAALVGLIVLDRVLRWFIQRPPLYLRGLADPAGLPVVMLLGYLGAWVAMPVENAVSRHFERQADMTSLELAGMPEVFIDAEKRLAVDNKGNVVPLPWNVWLFNTHPTAIQRIEMAERWQQLHPKK
jgi:STE24 endopeptidase